MLTCAMKSHDHQWARLSARLMLLSLEKAPWNVAGKLAIGVADSWHLLPLDALIRANFCFDVLLDTLTVSELVVLVKDSFHERSTDQL